MPTVVSPPPPCLIPVRNRPLTPIPKNLRHPLYPHPITQPHYVQRQPKRTPTPNPTGGPTRGRPRLVPVTPPTLAATHTPGPPSSHSPPPHATTIPTVAQRIPPLHALQSGVRMPSILHKPQTVMVRKNGSMFYNNRVYNRLSS